MIRYIAAVAAVVAVVGPAAAQTFSGQCTDYRAKGKDACVATQWCRWIERKAITLPDGRTVQPEGVCSFKSGFKAAIATAPKQQ